MTWLTRIFSSSERASQTKDSSPKKNIPEGVWSQCNNCQSVLYRGDLERHLNVCSQCGHHMYISAKQRLTSFVDENSMVELAKDIVPVDHLKFRDVKRYKDRLTQAQKKTEQKDALLVVEGLLYDMAVVACAFEYGFIGGSMGVAVGDRFVCGAKRAMEKHCPFICFAASGGARMQEGVLSLMQMAKTSAVLARLADCGLPFISVLTHPTMGGVSASLGMLGDIIIAEPKALIGFTGPRVIKQTVKQVLPEGFQCSEFLLEHGAIDMIMDRRQMRFGIACLLAKLMSVSQPMLEESE